MSTFIVFLYLQNRYLLDISCTYLLNRAGKRHDTSHLFLQMIQGNYLKSFAVDVILSCFKLAMFFLAKIEVKIWLLKSSFALNSSHIDALCTLLNLEFPKLKLSKVQFVYILFCFRNTQYKFLHSFTDRKVKNIETMRNFN